MKTKKEGLSVKNSNAQTNNLPEVEIIDNTTTKGKVTGKFTIVDDSSVTDSIEKQDKNKVFAEVTDYFCPVRFDSSTLEANLQPLVDSGILSEDAMQKAIETAKKEFLEKHADVIEKANNLSFVEVVAKLKENQTLYDKVLNVCNISEISEGDYLENGKVLIYRANQCTDKEGRNRYSDATLTKEINGKKFVQPLFVELREQTTSNVILSIRYAQSRRDATRKLFNQISDYNKILVAVSECAKKAKENGFSLSQVVEAINKVFEEKE